MRRTTYPNQAMVAKLAWSFHYTTGIEFEELHSEAKLAYYEALQKFDSNRGVKAITWCYTAITNHLINFSKVEMRNSAAIDIEGYDAATSRQPLFVLLSEFEGTSLELVELILSNPARYAESRKKAQSQLKEDLLARGWNIALVKEAFQAVSQTLQTIYND